MRCESLAIPARRLQIAGGRNRKEHNHQTDIHRKSKAGTAARTFPCSEAVTRLRPIFDFQSVVGQPKAGPKAGERPG